MSFHIIQGEMGIIEKNIPLLLMIMRVCQGEDIPHPIRNHVLMSLILILFDWVYVFNALGI